MSRVTVHEPHLEPGGPDRVRHDGADLGRHENSSPARSELPKVGVEALAAVEECQRVRTYWVHSVWILTVLLADADNWWSMWSLRDAASWLPNHVDRAERLGAALGPTLVQLPPRWKRNVERLDEFLSVATRTMRWAAQVQAAQRKTHRNWYQMKNGKPPTVGSTFA